MRLRRLRVSNFRCFKGEFVVGFDDLTAIIGRNDVGKSTLMDALAMFFDEAKPDCDDGCVDGDKKDVVVACAFDELPTAIDVDRGYQTTLAQEHMLNAEGLLEVCKHYDCSLKTPKLTAVCSRAVHPRAAGRGDLLTLKNAELKKRADELNVDLTGVNKGINAELRQAIWRSTEQLDAATQDIPLSDESAKQIWDKLKSELPVFALFKSDRMSTDQDDEAQDPLTTAVKEALKAHDAELQQIAQHVETEVRAIAQLTVEKLKQMDATIAGQLTPRFGSLNWSKVFSVSLTGEGEVPINKRGSGVRRLVLLNFFRAKAEQRMLQAGAAGVIYAIEEPETSQHPHNQRMLMTAFAELASQPNTQVLLTTHTPVMARLLPSASVRFLRAEPDGTRVILDGEQAVASAAESLGVLADHDVRLFIGVEGIHDESFLRTISRILATNGEDLPNLDELTNKGQVLFFPLGGSNLVLWSSRLRGLNRPEFHLYDRDVEPKTTQHKNAADTVNARAGCKAVLTSKRELENYLHHDAIVQARPEVRLAIGDDDDIPMLAAKAIHEAAPTAEPWDRLGPEKLKKKESAAKHWLNTDAVARMTPQRLSESDPNDDVRSWLGQMKAMLERQGGQNGT